MKKTLLIFSGISVLALAVALALAGNTIAFRSFAVGYGIFAANVLLWTVIVKELLDSAAYGSLAQQRAGLEETSDAPPPADPPISPTAEEGTADTETKHPPSNRGLVIMVVSMALKVALLGGGIYLCLAVLKLLAVYFVGGLAAGLAFLAVAGYWSRH